MASQRGTSTSTTGRPSSGQDRRGEPAQVRAAAGKPSTPAADRVTEYDAPARGGR